MNFLKELNLSQNESKSSKLIRVKGVQQYCKLTIELDGDVMNLELPLRVNSKHQIYCNITDFPDRDKLSYPNIYGSIFIKKAKGLYDVM